MKKTVWVLTEEHNDYNQHGEYFVAVFGDLPTVQRLASALSLHDGASRPNVMEALALIEHIRNGGGRIGTEDVWYNLKEQELI